MTAAAIRGKVGSLLSTPVGGPYHQGNTSAVTVFRCDGAIVWESGMSIDCDGQPGSACNINTDPYFQSSTSWSQSDGKALKAEELPFVVIPLSSPRWNYRDSGIKGGDLVVMAYKDKYVFGVVGDLGPSDRIGEGSYAAASALGINPNPRSGGVGSGVTYVVFPGTRVNPIESKAEAVRVGTAKLAEWLGTTVPDTTPEPPQGGEQLTAVDKMIAEAEKTLGWSDENNTVRTPVHTWYNNKFGNPDSGKYAWDWCDGWVTYVAWMAGQQKAVVFNTGYAYTVAHADDFRAKGQWHAGTSGIKAGDIAFFDWDGSNSTSAIDHVGLVVKVDSTGIHTIEGNIENAVRRKVRTEATIAGYGRPAYSDVATPPPTTEPPAGAAVKLSEAKAHQAAATKVIQTALNKFRPPVTVDGDYGPKTAAAYKAWQQSLGWPGDGEPSAHSLSELGKKYGFPVDLEGAVPTPPATVPPTTPPPTTPPVEPPVSQSVVFEDCGPGGTARSNKIVQAALNKFKPPVTVDGDWGPKTTAAYKAWQQSLGYSGSDADGKPGITSLTRLGAKYGFNVTRRSPGTPSTPPVTQPPPTTGGVSEANYLTAPEPAANYARVGYGGRTVNKRTAEMLALAARWAGVTITLTQGSYNAGGVSASAGTHDGGGAVDINVNNWSSSTRSKVVQALRKAGFAAWLRTPDEGFAYHIHGIAIGDREASSGAKGQVQSYFNGRNGLANNRASTGETHWPNWADKYNQ